MDYKYLGYFSRDEKDQALKLLASYNSGLPLNMPTHASCPTFKEMADLWLEKHIRHLQSKKGSVSGQLNASYSAAIKKCSAIHTKPINRIKFQGVQDIADSISNMSVSSVTNVKTALFETFDLARKQKYITENFINDIDFLYKQKEDKIHSSFSRAEVDELWSRSEDYRVQIVLIMIYSGLRIEEFLSMQTANVHLSEKYMTGGVKTSAGKNRIIPIADKILPFVCRLYDPSRRYLFNHRGKRYSRTCFLDQVWTPVMQKLATDHLPHDTRYTCATLMDRASVNENCKKNDIRTCKARCHESDLCGKGFTGPSGRYKQDLICILCVYLQFKYTLIYSYFFA